MTAHPPRPLIPVAAFSAQDLPPAERLHAWIEHLGPSYTVGAEREGFHAEARMALIDGMGIRALDAGRQSLARTRAQIRRDGLDHISLHFNLFGYDFRWNDGPGRLRPGEISINDLARPFERSDALERGSVVLTLPRETVERMAPGRVLHGVVLSGATAALLGAHMQMIAGRIGELPRASARCLRDATAAMLGAALASGTAESTSFDAARTIEVKRHIRRNLSRLSLGPDSIAREMRVSRTKLYRLFEAEGGVARYIAARRLAAAAEALRDPGDFRLMSALVAAFGFGSAAAFSRAFRARYGETPSDFRRRRRLGAAEDFGQQAFAAWLRQIG